MAAVSKESDVREEQAPPGRREEFFVFITIAALIWPAVAVGIVGGYGFIVWMFQMIFGPPGPPVH
jgi:nitrate reductase NapE